jgi:hypothetical protein
MATRIEHSRFAPALAGRSAPAPPHEVAHGSPPNRGRWVTAVRWGAVLMSLLGLGTIVLLLLAFGWHAMQPAPPSAKIGPKAYVRVQEGMAREEVQSAIGLPPGDYRDSAHKPGGRLHTEWSEEAAGEEFGARDSASRLQWEGNTYSIVAGFDEAGLVTWKTLWRHVPPTPHGPREQLRAWLGL